MDRTRPHRRERRRGEVRNRATGRDKAQLESLKTLEAEMAAVDAQFREILQGDLPSFNQALTQANLAPLLAVLEKRRNSR